MRIYIRAGDSFYVVFSGEVGLYFEPGAPEDAVSVYSGCTLARMYRGDGTLKNGDQKCAATPTWIEGVQF